MILLCINNWTRACLYYWQFHMHLIQRCIMHTVTWQSWQKIYRRSDSILEYIALFVRIWNPVEMFEIIHHLHAWRVARVCRAILLKRVSSEHLLATVRNVALWCPADCSVWRNVPEYNLFPPLAGKVPARPFSQACKHTSVHLGVDLSLPFDWYRSLSCSNGK